MLTNVIPASKLPFIRFESIEYLNLSEMLTYTITLYDVLLDLCVITCHNSTYLVVR